MNGRALFARVLSVFRGDRGGRFDEEMKLHAEMLAAEYVARGLPESEARYAAARELGNIVSLREEHHEQSGLPMLENAWRDLKFAVRSLRRNLIFTLSCTSVMAVALGSMMTVLCVVSAVLFRPLPYPKPDRLVAIKEVDPRNGLWAFSEPALLDLQQRSWSLTAVAAYRKGRLALTGAGDAESLWTEAVTPSFFSLLGIKPILGQTFEKSQKGVVVSRALWSRKWHMNPHVVGQIVTLDGESYAIDGIADLPEDLFPGTDLLLPLIPKATESRTAHEIDVLGRLRPDIDRRQAQGELAGVAASIARENNGTNAGWSMRLIPLAEYLTGPRTVEMIWMVLAAVAFLALLACANVAGLQLARSIARRHEMSTRLALGASRGRLYAQTLTESCVLACAGSLLGIILAQSATRVLRSFVTASWPAMAQVQMGGPAIGIAIVFMLATTFLFTAFTLRSVGLRGDREISRRNRGRDALIVVQVALASVLFLGTGLLFHSFLRLSAVDPGFDPDRILTVRASLPGRTYDDSRRVAFFREVAERLARLPAIQSVGATNVAPFGGEGTANRFRVEGTAASEEFLSAAWRAVTPGFFPTLGIPLKRGRLFTEGDRNGSPEVVILSESMARKYWPNQNPVGRRLLWGRSQSPKTIVGIVGDLRDLAADAPPQPTMFRPYSQLSDAPMTLVIRTKADPLGAIVDVRGEIGDMDRDVALDFQSLRRAMSDSVMRPRISLLSVPAFAFVAIVTAGFGLYGLIGYRVNQRQREIGMRLALGAPAGSVRWNVQKQCLTLVGAGLAIGLPVAYSLSTLMRSLLYDTQPAQPGAYLMVLLVFATVAFIASYGPARRASRMDPAAAIRHE